MVVQSVLSSFLLLLRLAMVLWQGGVAWMELPHQYIPLFVKSELEQLLVARASLLQIGCVPHSLWRVLHPLEIDLVLAGGCAHLTTFIPHPRLCNRPLKNRAVYGFF
jgi:hypothetical protein